MRKRLAILFFTFYFIKTYSQTNESIFLLNYTLAPLGSNDLDLYKTDMTFSIPIKVKKGMIFASTNFDYYQINYNGNNDLNFNDLSKFYKIGFGLEYHYSISEKWDIIPQINPFIASNLSRSISNEDIFFNGSISLSKKGGTTKQPTLFTLGLSYSDIIGKSRVLPLISYTKRVTENFSYGIGFPNTFVKYQINEKSTITTSVNVEGFYTNISNNIKEENNVLKIDKAEYTMTSLSLGYSFKMEEPWVVVFNVSHFLYNNYKLMSGSNTAYGFNNLPEFSFTIGLKYNFKNKNKRYD